MSRVVVGQQATKKADHDSTAINTVQDLEAIWASNEAPVEEEVTLAA